MGEAGDESRESLAGSEPDLMPETRRFREAIGADAAKREHTIIATSFHIGCIDLETNTMETVVIAEGEVQEREDYGRDYRAVITKTA